MNIIDTKITFKVSMDSEAKKNEEFEEVEFLLSFPDTCKDQLVADAVAHQKVKWQQQIRSNWSKFVENGVPEKIEYGQPLFGGRRSSPRPPTQDEMQTYMAKAIANLNPAGIAEFARTGRLPTEKEFLKS